MTVTGTDLCMTRGDSEIITVRVTGYTLTEGDMVELTVRRNVKTPPVLYKRVTEFRDNAAQIAIDPQDTRDLPFGVYVYDVQLTYGGAVKTIIRPSKFTIGEEVTHGYLGGDSGSGSAD